MIVLRKPKKIVYKYENLNNYFYFIYNFKILFLIEKKNEREPKRVNLVP